MELISRVGSNMARRWKRFIEHLNEQEYCKWASPYLRSLRQPLGVLVLMATAALLCGQFAAPQGFVVFGAIIVVITVGCVWPWVGIRGVSCQLSFTSQRAVEGAPVEAELVITNRWPWPVWGLAIEGGFRPDEQANGQAAIAISHIGGWSRGRYRWSFTPSMRGHYPISCPQLVTEFPFGLWKAKKRVDVSSSLIAWPQRFPLPPLPLASGTQSWIGQPSECAAGSLGHRTTVREYRPGDSMRQIHWAKTALYNKLVSYEREGLAVADATITIDTQRSLHPETGPQSTLEWSIRIAASICEALLRQGVGVTVVAHSARFQIQSNRSDPSMLLDWFATLDAGQSDLGVPVDRSCSSRVLAALTLHITTDLTETTRGDSIVLLTKADPSSEGCARYSTRSWIVVKQGGDVPSQVRKGWRNGPRKIQHAC